MRDELSKKGYKAGLALGFALTAGCMLAILFFIFFPQFAIPLGFSMTGLAIGKGLLTYNFFFALIGCMLWQDAGMRRQIQYTWTDTSYPLLLGLFGAITSYTLAYIGKIMGEKITDLWRFITSGNSTKNEPPLSTTANLSMELLNDSDGIQQSPVLIKSQNPKAAPRPTARETLTPTKAKHLAAESADWTVSNTRPRPATH